MGERLVYAWRGGHAANEGYGAPLDTVVTFTLIKVARGTRLRLVHSGFRAPQNDAAFKGMSGGWQQVFQKIDALAAAQSSSKAG